MGLTAHATKIKREARRCNVNMSHQDSVLSARRNEHVIRYKEGEKDSVDRN